MNSPESRIVIPVQNFKAGEVIFEEGDHGQELYVMRSGKVSVRKLIENQDIEIVQLESGSIFGEMAILDQGVRSATVVAIEPTQVTCINQTSYEQVVGLLPTWLKAILKIVAKRLTDLNQKIDRPMVQNTLLSLCLFLFRKHRESLLKQSGPLYLNELRNDYCFLTRVTEDAFNKAIDSIKTHNIIELTNNDTECTVVDESLLRLYIDAHSAKMKKRSFGPFELERSSIVFIQTLVSMNEKSPLPEIEEKEFWERLIAGLVQKVGFEVIQNLSKEGIFEIDLDKKVKLDIKKLEQYHFALSHKDLVLGMK